MYKSDVLLISSHEATTLARHIRSTEPSLPRTRTAACSRPTVLENLITGCLGSRAASGQYIFSLAPLAKTSFFFFLALFAFWLRSSVVSVLFSLISETSLRRHSRLFLFLDLVGIPLSLLMYLGTVSPVLHCLGLTRIMSFSLMLQLFFAGD